jgi:hypothetical protein
MPPMSVFQLVQRSKADAKKASPKAKKGLNAVDQHLIDSYTQANSYVKFAVDGVWVDRDVRNSKK